MNEDWQDLLVSRVVEGSASAEDLRELAAAAGADGELWDRVASSLQAEASLRGIADAAASAAERVALPAVERPRSRLAIVAAVGWAAAAALALVVALRRTPPIAPPLAPVAERGTASGERLADLPPVLLEARPSPAGVGFEVVFVRRTIERLVGERLFDVGHDEHGRLAPVPAPAAAIEPPCSL
jgi:hypothetical protein